ncbi:MAG: AAA family ATPase [Caldilineaceae bacterium]|nr:AAA family ATPase [Caldilineaceae bacterium]
MSHHSPFLVATKGHPATGKSALARALARRLGWPLIDKDDIKDHTLHLPNANDLAYSIMWTVVETQLGLGISVIAVSPLSYPAGYSRAQELAARHHARLLVLETVLEESVWKERLEARPPHDSTHKIRGWAAMQEMLRQYNGCWQYPIAPEHHLQVDSAQPLSQLVQVVLDRLHQAKQEPGR